MDESFVGLVAHEPGAAAEFTELTMEDLDAGDVTIAVEWSSCNYKDALAVTGRSPVVRRFPAVCGIDLAGRVVASAADGFPVGSEVIVTGSGLGETRDGGYAAFARVQASSCVLLPEGLDARQAMGLGTAGLTAMLAIQALEAGGCNQRASEELPILVTGAAGGVGSIAVALLAAHGYRVVAASGRPTEQDYLMRLGAAEVIGREEFSEPAPNLGRERFAGCVDVVGGNTLANVVASTRTHGVVAACGNVGGAALPMTVYPFILRGVSLIGINSVWPPAGNRLQAWKRIADTMPRSILDEMMSTVELEQIPEVAGRILVGSTRGRVAVAIGSERPTI